MDDERYIFKDLIASGAVTVYLDDILILSKTKAEHRRDHTRSLKDPTKEQAIP